jgi:hypothetical protein
VAFDNYGERTREYPRCVHWPWPRCIHFDIGGAAIHSWEEAVLTYRTYTSVQQALKKQIITVFYPMYLDILSDDMVCFANITALEMLYHLLIVGMGIPFCNLYSLVSCILVKVEKRFL